MGEKLDGTAWLGRLFLRMVAGLGVALLGLALLPWTRPYVPLLVSMAVPGPPEPATPGRAVLGSRPGDLLLVVSQRALNRAAEEREFTQVRWSYAWLGLLEQELGRPSVAEVETLQPWELEGRRVVIFTRSATEEEPPQVLLDAAREAASRGAAVILELPGSDWSSLSGVVLAQDPVNTVARVLRAKPLQFEELPGTLGGEPPGRNLARLREMPVLTWLKKDLVQEAPLESRGRLAGLPALYVRPQGRGAVVTLAFDLGCQVQALQQGAPSGPGWRVGERGGRVAGMPEAQDLVLDPVLLDNSEPFADLLEAWMVDMAEDAAGPLPGWWRFPFAYDGVAAVSFDQEEEGPEGGRPPGPEPAGPGVPVTLFALAGPRYARHPGHPGLLWNLFWTGEGMPGRRPGLQAQADRFAALRGERPRLGRSHLLAWGDDYAAPFGRLAAAGIELDSTYGPVHGRGYLFGTGLPFRALDERGLPLPVWEWPFVSLDTRAGADGAFLRRLVDDSSRSYHQAPLVALGARALEADRRTLLAEFLRAARGRRHWVASMEDYHRFLQMRAGAGLVSALEDGGLRVEVEAPGAGLALRLPAGPGPVLLDGRPARTRIVRLVDRLRVLVEIPRGRHLVTVPVGPGMGKR